MTSKKIELNLLSFEHWRVDNSVVFHFDTRDETLADSEFIQRQRDAAKPGLSIVVYHNCKKTNRTLNPLTCLGADVFSLSGISCSLRFIQKPIK